MTQHETISFDRAASFYDQTRGFPPEVEPAIGQMIAQAGNLTAQSHILEIAIGTGRVALPFARESGAKVHGVDISLGMMRRIVAKQTTEIIYPVQADVYHLPYADDTFDAILAVHIFHLLPEFEPLHHEMRRVLKPEGKILQCWNTNDSPLNNARRRMMSVARGRPNNWEQADSYLQVFSWRQLNYLTHEFVTQLTPQEVIDSFRNRLWSSTWTMTDDEIAERVMLLQREFTELYGDLSLPVNLPNQFHASAYGQPT
jgi:ubiquinone/menaquinone biosynthesis C-methylase UbiE